MTKVEITSVTGGTPIDVYVADYYGNHKLYLGTITGNTINPVPPIVYYYPSGVFDNVPIISLLMIDTNGCENVQYILCTT